MVIFTPCIMNMQIITFKSVSQHFGRKHVNRYQLSLN
uniref:Uncharacterized protein n=1 Tax=Anguilla anguilla TaxID=7936 RepID=A0A0E9RH14_ANGAN